MMRRGMVTGLVLLCVSFALPAWGKLDRIYEGKLNINTATAADLARLPGIGDVIAYRIEKERRRSGDFVDIAQLKDIKGISDSVFGDLKEHVKLHGMSDLKVYMDVNTVTIPLLMRVPAMTEGQATAIIEYRTNAGKFKSIAELRKVPGIDDRRAQELSEWLAVSGK